MSGLSPKSVGVEARDDQQRGDVVLPAGVQDGLGGEVKAPLQLSHSAQIEDILRGKKEFFY